MALQDDDLFSESAKKLRKLIKDKNIKPAEIVNALGVSRENVSKWMQESAPPNAHHLLELAKLLGVTERWMNDFKEKNDDHQNKKTSTAHVQDEKKPLVTANKLKQHDISLKEATAEQLIEELKARYADLNLKADIKISVEPIQGGFVVKE